jgi:YidC/Oxa1 family membrane protein insertase
VDIYAFAPIAALLDLAYSGVTALATALTPLAATSATALAIATITLLVRSALSPVGRSQVRAEFSRRRLAPKLRELQRRYKKSPELLQRKTMELYTAEKASPLAGCLPTLIQAPIVSIVYGLFILATINGHPNGLLTETLAGVPLGTSLITLVGSGGQPWPGLTVYLVLLVIIAVVAWLQRRATKATTALSGEQVDVTAAVIPGMAGAASALSWLPFLTVVFAAIVPLAATIYLAITTTWTLVERALLRRSFAARDAV